MAEKKLRVGVIGVGYVSKNNFLPVLPRFDDVEFVGLMASKLENAQNAQRLCGAQHAVASLEEFASLGLDCAFVLTPKQCHAEQISYLLEQGIDVYSEKPMATTLKDAAHIADVAAKTGNKLMIGFNRRYAPVCQKAKAVYGDGFPEVIIAQKNRPATEYRATLENAIHMVDLMRYYGGEVKDVRAHADRRTLLGPVGGDHRAARQQPLGLHQDAGQRDRDRRRGAAQDRDDPARDGLGQVRGQARFHERDPPLPRLRARQQDPDDRCGRRL